MKVISFGRWGHSAGRWFTRDRIYFKGYIWTPFCHIERRYKHGGMKGLNLQKVWAAIQKALGFSSLTAPSAGRTPGIPHSKRGMRSRAHVPNDGRWHMKFHRSR